MKDKNYIPITQSLIHAIMQSLISLFTQSLIHTIMQSLISLLSHKGQNGAGVLVGGEQKAALVEPRNPSQLRVWLSADNTGPEFLQTFCR